MLVPEATVDEDSFFSLCEGDIWLPRQVPRVNAEAITQAIQ